MMKDLEKMELLGGESIQEWSKTINAAPYVLPFGSFSASPLNI
jgi:hypothetical protein